MRRFFAFIALAFSLLVATVVGIPTIKDSVKNGTEFNGGYQIVYHLTDSDGLEYQGTALKTQMKKATDTINSRLNTLNVTNPEVGVLDDDCLQVTIADVNDSQLNVIRNALSNNGKVSFRDTSDVDLIEQAGYKYDDVIKNVSVMKGSTNNILAIELKDGEAFHEISHKLASSYQGTNENPQPNLIIWMGFEESYTDEMKEEIDFVGDSYAEAGVNEYAAFKILAQVAVDEHIEESFSVNTTISDANMSLYNKILDQNNVSYHLHELYTSKVGSYRATNIPTMAVIAGIIGLVLICAFFVVSYHLSGLVASLSVIVFTVISFLLYTLFGGLFGAETVIAIFVGIALALSANVVFLERIKAELRKGKKLDRAYEEGSRKSVSTVLDANVLILIASLVMYLLGTQVVKSFAAMLIISQIMIIIVVVLLTRLMLSLICKSNLFTSPSRWFNVKESEIKDINEVEASQTNAKLNNMNFVKHGKMKAMVLGGIVCVGFVLGLILQLAFGNFFNYTSSLKSGTRVYFRTVNSEYATAEKISDAFKSNDLAGRTPSKVIVGEDVVIISTNDLQAYSSTFEKYNLDIDTVSRNRVTLYGVSVYYDRVLDSNAIDAIKTVFEEEELDFYNTEDKENTVELFKTNFTIGTYVPTSGTKSILNGLFVLGIVCVLSFIYLAIRFSFSYAFSGVVAVLGSELGLFGLLALTRISIGTEAIAFGLALAILVLNTLSITFDKLRENINEANGVVWNMDTRGAFINTALQETFYGHMFTYMSYSLLGVILLCFSACKMFSLSFVMFFVLLSAVFVAIYCIGLVWPCFDTIHAKALDRRSARRASRNKNKPTPNTKEVEEYVFYGIND